MPTSNKKAKSTAPPLPDAMPPPSATPLKKAKTEALHSDKACAVKGGVVGRPPATPQAKAPASLTSQLPMPPPLKTRDLPRPPTPAAPPAKPLGVPHQPAYVNAHCGVPKAVGVKMDMKPSQNAAAALRRSMPRPTTKVELSEPTVPAVPKTPAAPPISKPAPISKAPHPPAPTTTTTSPPPPPAKASAPQSKANAVPPAPGAPQGMASSLSTDGTPPTGAKVSMPVPPKTTNAQKTPETEAEREERLRNWVAKMDEVEMKQRIEKIKHDPLFPQYQQWLRTEIFDLPPEEQLPEFGEHDEDEELVSFLLWLERPSSKPSLENSMPDPNPAETAAVAVAEPKAVAPGPVTPGPETHEPQSKKVTFSPEVMVHKSPAVDNLAVNTASTAAPAAPTAPALCPASSAVTTIPLAAEHSPPASILKAPEAKAAPPAPVSTAAPRAPTPPASTPTSPASTGSNSPSATTASSAAATPPASTTTHSTALVPAGTLASQIQVHAPVSQLD